MNYQFVTAKYDRPSQNIILHARDENRQKLRFEIVGFQPYFYFKEEWLTPKSDNIVEVERDMGYTSVYGEPLAKVIVDKPSSVYNRRKQTGVRTLFPKTYEADIPFVRRFMIDTQLKCGFTTNKKSTLIRYSDIIPTDFSLSAKVIVLDIEVFTKARFPDPNQANNRVIAITIWDSDSRRYVSILLDEILEKIRVADDHYLFLVDTEEKLLKLVVKYVRKLKGDIITGWNVWFDITYLVNRTKKLNLPVFDYEGYCIFDLMEGYGILHKSLGQRLKEAVLEDNIAQEVVSDEFHIEWYENPETRRTLFIEYNKKDVEYCVKIDEKRGITDFFWGLKNQTGLEDMGGTTYHGVLMDVYFLRMAHNRWVLPTRFVSEKQKLEGAIVFAPKPGLYENVGTFDLSRYYPNIVISYKLSPDPERTLAPEVCLELLQVRAKLEEELAALDHDDPAYESTKKRRDEVKYLLNSVWGVMSWTGFRLYDWTIGDKVLSKAREGLQIVKDVAEKNGLLILTGDTDSLVIQIGDRDPDEIVKILNDALDRFCESEGIAKNLKVKMDRFSDKVIFTDAKKRRAEHVVWEDGKEVDYILIKGFENVRRDASKVTRRVQLEVFEAVLRKGKDHLSDYLKQIVQDMKSGKYSLEDIAIRKQLSKEFTNDDYPSTDYYSGSVWSNKYLGLDIRPGDQVKMIKVKYVPGFPKTNAICFIEASQFPKNAVIDWSGMIDRTIKNKVEEIINIAGIRWGEVYGRKRLGDVF